MTHDVPAAVGPHVGRGSNPFATRFMRPGVVPPLDVTGQAIAIEPLLDRLRPGCVVIEGPHGRGKTNLLRALLAAAAARGRGTSFTQIRSARHAWTALAATATAAANDVVAIDGWERVPRLLRWMIVGVARRRRATVVTTSHGSCGLEILARCESSPAQFAAIVAALPDHGGLIDGNDLDAAFHRHGGNVRDALGELYDRFETRAAARLAGRS